MPYRRLPNTDNSRKKALEAALLMIDSVSFNEVLYRAEKTIVIKNLLNKYNHVLSQNADTIKYKKIEFKKYNEFFRLACLYLNHYFKVLFMAIQRGEINNKVLEYYDFSSNVRSIPVVRSEEKLISIAEKVFEGERKRVMNGGVLISMPSMALVKINFERFYEIYKYKDITIKKRNISKFQTENIRKEIDLTIALLWDEIETNAKKKNPYSWRELCIQYGIKYVFRKSEIEKIKTNNL